jgi:flagellar basal body-associated protein FliL
MVVKDVVVVIIIVVVIVVAAAAATAEIFVEVTGELCTGDAGSNRHRKWQYLQTKHTRNAQSENIYTDD